MSIKEKTSQVTFGCVAFYNSLPIRTHSPLPSELVTYQNTSLHNAGEAVKRRIPPGERAEEPTSRRGGSCRERVVSRGAIRGNADVAAPLITCSKCLPAHPLIDPSNHHPLFHPGPAVPVRVVVATGTTRVFKVRPLPLM